MAKGQNAKDNLLNLFIKSNPKNYIGCFDKKHYFWSEENGEKVQIAISMTCPKNPVGEVTVISGGGMDFSAAAPTAIAPSVHEPAEISEDEKNNIADLMARLNLI